MAYSPTDRTVGAKVAYKANRRQMGFWAKMWFGLVGRLLDGLVGGLAEENPKVEKC